MSLNNLTGMRSFPVCFGERIVQLPALCLRSVLNNVISVCFLKSQNYVTGEQLIQWDADRRVQHILPKRYKLSYGDIIRYLHND